MDVLLKNRLLIAVAGVIIGAFLGYLLQIYRRRRDIFSYSVDQSRHGLPTEDFFIMKGMPDVTNLYGSTIELRNMGMNDHADVEVRVIAKDTYLLSERTEVLGTSRNLELTKEYLEQVSEDQKRWEKETSEDRDPWWGLRVYRERHYTIPVINRGQVVRFSYLTMAADVKAGPLVRLEILHQGVRLKYQERPSRLIWGVSEVKAAFTGIVITSVGVIAMAGSVDNVWLASFTSFLLGLIAVVPGAAALWLYDIIKKKVVG